jgi:hypothetical protein
MSEPGLRRVDMRNFYLVKTWAGEYWTGEFWIRCQHCALRMDRDSAHTKACKAGSASKVVRVKTPLPGKAR